MKKFKLFFAYMLMSLFSIGQVWAASITVDANPTTSGTFTISADKAGGSNAPIVTGGYVRLYANNTLTISTSGGANITAMTIAWTKNGSKAFATVSTETGSYTHPSAAGNGTWTGSATEIVFTVGSSGQIQITSVDITVEEGGKTLSSIAVSGTPTTDTYDEGDAFNPAGLTVTGTYSDNSQATISSGITWTACKTESGTYVVLDNAAVALAKDETDIYIKATVSEKTSAAFHVTGLTVNEHVVTPGEYTINLNNTFYGISSGNNATEQSASQNDITVVSGCTSSASSKTYYDSGHIRYYADSYLHVSVPSGYAIKSIVFTAGGTWNGSISANVGAYADATKTWSGNSQIVEFSFAAQNRASSIKVTYAADIPVSDCATPIFSPAAGSYEGTQSVTITCETEGATIYYTTDGSDPTTNSAIYSDAISVSTTQTIKAYAAKDGLNDSEVAEATYTITAGADVVLDFTSNTEWQFPTTTTVNKGSYSAGNYTIEVAGSTGKGYKFDTNHLFIGQSGAYITLPTLDFPISKVVCMGVASGSSKVTFN